MTVSIPLIPAKAGTRAFFRESLGLSQQKHLGPRLRGDER